MNDYYRVTEVAKRLKLSPATVRKMTEDGRLPCSRNPLTNQRVFLKADIDKLLGETPTPEIVFYVRSSKGDKAAMDAQVELLTQEYGEPLKVYRDAGSGLSVKRKALWSMIKASQKGNFNQVIVTNLDRLSRFGVEYIEYILNTNNVSIIALNDKQDKTMEEEAFDDFMSLVASFAGRFYRNRSRDAKKKLLTRAGDQLE